MQYKEVYHSSIKKSIIFDRWTFKWSFKNFCKKGRWTVYTGFYEFFKCKEFTKVFQEAIATTKEYLVDKKSWAAPFEGKI